MDKWVRDSFIAIHKFLSLMQMMHPYIIDTSVIYNTSGERRKKTKLARLVAEFLSETIQASKNGHDSIEDSCSALKLVQLKLQKSKYIFKITL